MSFWSSLFHGIEVGVGIATSPGIAPIISVLPGGSIISSILQAILAAEKLVPASGNGPAKKVAVTALVTAQHPTVEPAKLSTAIDTIVAALNQLEVAAAAVAPK